VLARLLILAGCSGVALAAGCVSVEERLAAIERTARGLEAMQDDLDARIAVAETEIELLKLINIGEEVRMTRFAAILLQMQPRPPRGEIERLEQRAAVLKERLGRR
jgi:hypothetical protein